MVRTELCLLPKKICAGTRIHTHTETRAQTPKRTSKQKHASDQVLEQTIAQPFEHYSGPPDCSMALDTLGVRMQNF